MTASMTGFKAGDVIWVSFPFVESERSKVRPALVVSDKMLGPENNFALGHDDYQCPAPRLAGGLDP